MVTLLFVILFIYLLIIISLLSDER